MLMIKFREDADEDERRLYRCLPSVQQPIELWYSNEDIFRFSNKAEMMYCTGIVGFC